MVFRFATVSTPTLAGEKNFKKCVNPERIESAVQCILSNRTLKSFKSVVFLLKLVIF